MLIKGSHKAKRNMANLRNRKVLKAHSDAMRDYEFLSGRDATSDFNEWMDCPHWHEWQSRGIADKFSGWVAERVRELRSGDDWKAEW
jgi:hypothetical protein